MQIILKTIAFLTIITLSQCTNMTCENNLPLSEKVSETDLLSFSFNKENFDDFRCNVSNATLTHCSLYKPPFYESESVRNFLSTLCLFFQYAELKKNTRFKRNIAVLFVIYSAKIHALTDDLTEYKFDPQTFKDRLLKLDETIKNILEEQDPNKQIVSVKEQGDRIIITQKLVSKNIHFKIVEEGIKEFSKEYLEDEVLVAGYELNTKIYELYLEGSIGNNYTKGTNFISKNYLNLLQSEPVTNNVTQKEPTTSKKGLYELLLRFDQVSSPSYSKSKTFKCHPSDYELSDEEKTVFENQCKDIALRKLVRGDVPEYYYELLFKLRAKVIWVIEDITDDFDVYTGYHPENLQIMLELKRSIKDYLQDHEKIFFYNELSEESINNLVKICLELIL